MRRLLSRIAKLWTAVRNLNYCRPKCNRGLTRSFCPSSFRNSCMIRYVIYARYSSDLQSPDSIEDQKRKCREYGAQEGWSEVRTYEDMAISGTGMDRHGFQRLMADSARSARDFDVILIDDTSRLSRSLADVVSV